MQMHINPCFKLIVYYCYISCLVSKLLMYNINNNIITFNEQKVYQIFDIFVYLSRQTKIFYLNIN